MEIDEINWSLPPDLLHPSLLEQVGDIVYPDFRIETEEVGR